MAKGMREIDWTTQRGSAIKLVLEYESRFIPSRLLDGGWGGSTKESLYSKRTQYISINGEDKGEVDEIREINPIAKKIQGKDLETLEEMGCTHYTLCHVGDAIQVLGLTMVPIDEINAAWTALESEVDDADVKRLKAAQAEAEHAADVSHAEEIIDCVDMTLRYFNGKLPNSEEVKKWRKAYNDINNEGGEGYIPEVVTEQQVEWAKKILAEGAASTSK